MYAVRLLIAQRRFAVLLCAATLLLKLLVPTGYMIDVGHGRMAITACPGVAPAAMPADMAGMHGGMADHRQPKEHAQAEMPCAFAGLSAAMTGAIDPVQLAALVAFVMAMGLVLTPPPVPRAPIRLRPPLRGPPARA